MARLAPGVARAPGGDHGLPERIGAAVGARGARGRARQPRGAGARASRLSRRAGQAASAEGLSWGDPDTALNIYTLDAAARAAGGVVAAVKAVLAGSLANAFCAVRPPGHHAEQAMAMGFCFYNNVAVGVHPALASGIERIAVVDFDVHHGNGTVEIFKDEPRVLVCSSFQHPFYPNRARRVDRPNIVNTPLPEGTRGAQFRAARGERTGLKKLDAHAPQMAVRLGRFRRARARSARVAWN